MEANNSIQASEVQGMSLRLSIMMFFQFAVWGIWLPYIATYLGAGVSEGGLGFDGYQIGAILGTAGAAGAIFAPFIAGQVADRSMNAERALGLLVFIGGLVNIILGYVTGYWLFLILSVIYSILYMPTLSLTNSICFANLLDSEKSFPRIRVWGTIGWIVASSLFPIFWLQEDIQATIRPWFFVGQELSDATARKGDALIASGIISIFYAIYAFLVLPKTPPNRDPEKNLAVFAAVRSLTKGSLPILLLAAVPISMIHTVYFLRTAPWLESIGFSSANIGAVMSVGQMTEIAVLGILGFIISRLGYRYVLILGAVAYAIRFAVFALAGPSSPGLAYGGIALHGFCFALFYAASFLLIDRVVEKENRHSAQTIYGIFLLGVGPILAGFYNGWLDLVAKPTADLTGFLSLWVSLLDSIGVVRDGSMSWPAIWWTQSLIAIISVVLLLFAFRPLVKKEIDINKS